jgi:glycosyltransferase involved in cell wall biosynthesis
VHIAILIGHFPPGAFGGAELQAEGWARRLADRHRVTVVTRHDPPHTPARERRDGFALVRLPVSRVPLWRTVADLTAIERAVTALTPRPDVLLCFQTFISGLAGVRLQRRLGVPAVVWIRGEAEYDFARSRVHRLVSPGVWRDAAKVLVQSEPNRVALLRQVERTHPRHLPALQRRLAVVPNGLTLPPDPGPPGTAVLTVGRLIPEKGMDLVIDAVAAVGGRLVIAGEGPERPTLEGRARAAGIDCRFVGHVGREALDALYRDAGVCVLAARHGEGLPNVVLEAMAHGRPVVATPCAGTRELLLDAVNGLEVTADAAHLAAALRRLREEPGLVQRLGAEARRTVARFDWDAVRPGLEAVLAEVTRPG